MVETNIDLIPAEEKIQRSKEKAKKLGLIVTVLLMLGNLGAAGAVFYYTNNIDIEISRLNDSIADKRKKIEEKAKIEIAARVLDTKYTALQKLFSERVYYSQLLDTLERRVPVTVDITTIDSSTPETVNISGEATDYVSLAKFLNALSNPAIASGSAQQKEEANMFKQVFINTVTLDPGTAKAKFNLAITVDVEQLKN